MCIQIVDATSGRPWLQVPAPPPPRASAPGGGPSAASSGGGDAPQSTRFSTRLEHMDMVTLHPFHDLDLAESELNSYCSSLAPDAETEKCWQAYSFLEQKREKAKAGCDLDNPKDCEDLERLNDMTHQLLATGSMDDLVATFSTLARVEEHRAARAAEQAEVAAPPAHTTSAEEAHADPIRALFAKMDTNGDGRLSIAEFRQGMLMFGDRLDGATVALVMDAMDVHDGFLSEQQFRDIVDAEAIVSHSQVVEIYRHHRHDRPSWWSAAPAGKGSMLA
ncbi:hypothetical protein ABPG75_008311 [Micractinium tetrahymenae]